MTKIISGTYLDFSNVLIRPKRSTVNSRSCVNLEREFKFKNSTRKWKGIPIMAANMDTTGTFKVYDVLSKHNMITIMNKFYNVDDYIERKDSLNPGMFAVSCGISDADYEKLVTIMDAIDCDWICVDIANGYLNSMVDFCKRVRERFPEKIIKPAIIKPVKASIIGVALIIMLAILIFFLTRSEITFLALLFSTSSF